MARAAFPFSPELPALIGLNQLLCYVECFVFCSSASRAAATWTGFRAKTDCGENEVALSWSMEDVFMVT